MCDTSQGARALTPGILNLKHMCRTLEVPVFRERWVIFTGDLVYKTSPSLWGL